MSGGSFDYLGIVTDMEDVLSKRHELGPMADALAELGYADDAATATHDIILELRRVTIRLDAMIAKVAPIWYAMEWWRSGDSGEDQLKGELVRYRAEGSAPDGG